jgi:branched-chain amino acid transport system substrate-binding protein
MSGRRPCPTPWDAPAGTAEALRRERDDADRSDAERCAAALTRYRRIVTIVARLLRKRVNKRRRNMTRITRLAVAVAFLAGASFAATAAGAKTIKVGILSTFTGDYAQWGVQFKRAIEIFLEENGTKVAGHDVQILYRDELGARPDVAKRLAEELIVQDKVDVIGGIVFTPNALAVAPVITEAKIPCVIFNAATHMIVRRSPYFVRTSTTLDQAIVPAVDWAAKNGVKSGMIVGSDYAPGQEAIKSFAEEFTTHSIKNLGDIKIPLATKDYSVYMEKIREQKPDGVFVFLALGPPSITFIKTFAERGLKDAGIKFIGTGEFSESTLPAVGDAAIGGYSSFHYSESHDSPLNKKFVAAHKSKFGPDAGVDLASVATYDGMHVIYEMIKRTDGKMGPAAVDAVKGMSWESPRGKVSIDPKERDIVQNIYIRRVEKADGKLINKEIQTYPDVKDPWKERNPG